MLLTFLDKASASLLSLLLMWWMSVVDEEIWERWWSALGEYVADWKKSAFISGLWSVQMMNLGASKNC